METKLKAPREKFDPTKKENWHFHDEYEFWYIEYPECGEVSGPHWLDKTRDCSFFPWEHIADASPATDALVSAVKYAAQFKGHREHFADSAEGFNVYMAFEDLIEALAAVDALKGG